MTDAIDILAMPPTVFVRDADDRVFALGLSPSSDITLTIGPSLDPMLLVPGLPVTAELDGTSGMVLVTSMVVTPLVYTGPVTSVDTTTRIVELGGAGGGTTLHVRDDAVVQQQTDTGLVTIDLTVLASGDAVEALGIPDVSGTVETWQLTVLQP